MNTIQNINKEIRTMYKSLVANQKSPNSVQLWWDFIAQFDSETIKNATAPIFAAEKRLREYKNSPLFKNKIRAFANHIMWTDVQAYEVIKIVSDKCVVIRRMNAEMVQKPTQFHVGGFSAHCSDNYSQKHEFTSCELNPTMRIRLTKTGWKNGNLKFSMSDFPSEFYDFNF